MANSWYSVTFPDAFSVPTSRMHDIFFALCLARGGHPKGMAAFSIMDRGTGEVTWFFTPEAGDLAKAFEAEPCQKPTPMPGLALAVGNDGSWEEHFPGYKPTLR